MRTLTMVATSLLLAVGCSSSSSGDAAQDTGSPADTLGSDTAVPVDSSPTDTNTDAGACGETLGLGSAVASTTETGTPPTSAGGTIADGTYTLTTIQFYGGAAPAGKSKITIKIEGSATHYQAASWDDSTPTVAHSCGAVANASPKINFAGMGTYDGYDASPTTLVLVKKVGAITNVFTYTKS
jgi:hypothetical protein